MPRITISYRRDDSGVITGRIFDRLATHYGREAVFRDIDNIPLGVDFRKHISGILDASDIVLAIVGPRWIGPRAGPSRLANAADPVRVEIETALRKDRPLIPVLVLRGSMPRVEQLPESLQDFAYRNAVSIDAGQDFDVHMARLIRAMDRSLEGVAAALDAAPNDPESILELDAPPGPGSPSPGEIDALRQGKRELEEQLAALTAVPEAQVTRPTENAVEAARARILAPAQDPRSARRLGRGAAFVLLGIILGIAATFGATRYLTGDQPILLSSAPDIDASASAKQAADAKAKALQEELSAARLQSDEDHKKQADALAAAEGKIAAAQKQVNDRATGLRDAQARADKAEKDLAAQKDISANALAQNAPLTSQIKSLSDQLAAQKDATAKALGQADQLKAQIKALADQQVGADTAEKELAAQKAIGTGALAQFDQLNGQIKSLRDQLAAAQAAPRTVGATGPPAAVGDANWTIDERREIQRALRINGHYQGEADGAFGAGTQTAIKQFQSFAGDPETGSLSETERRNLLDMAQRLSALFDRPANSPQGVAAASIKGAAQRYARGWNFETGKGVKADPAEAAYWYALAAADGEAKAFTNLGTLLARGWAATRPDPAAAALLWRAAAPRGEATAMFNLGAMYERGIGVSADLARARAWYERAAALDNPDARAALKRLEA